MVDTNYIVTSVSPVTFIQCFQLTSEEGEKQLSCILQNGKSYFRISSDSPHKIRFVHTDFRAQIDNILRESESLQKRQLCNYLVSQIRDGHVILETKDKAGKIRAITSTGHTAGSNTKKQYSHIELADKAYFEEIAKDFEKNLDAILASLSEYNAKERRGPTAAEAERKKQDLAFITARKTPFLQRLISRRVAGLVTEICKAFPKTIAKILKRMQEDAIEQDRLRKRDYELRQKKEIHEEADLRKLEAKMIDIKLEAQKAECIAQKS